MSNIALYFQMHQPNRVRRYSVFDDHPRYFDDAANADICKKVADKCYRPATQMLLELAIRHQGAFRVAFSITGVLLEQLETNCPDVVMLLQQLVRTGHCEVLAETYFHSLVSLYSQAEFDTQVAQHTHKIETVFGVTPRVFRNTELIYSNDIARHICEMKDGDGKPRFTGILTEGVERVLRNRKPNAVFAAPGCPLRVLARDSELSDDIAFRFSSRQWNQWPLTAAKFAQWAVSRGGLVNLFMDFETLGEHQWADTGIFQFVSALPEAIWTADKNARFLTPSQALAATAPTGIFDSPQPISWADQSRDVSTWRGNAMQVHALEELYRLERLVKDRVRTADEDGKSEAQQALTDWRKLTTSDHVYYMSTKGSADGSVHAYFRPYESPYEAYISFMNVLENLRKRVAAMPHPQT